MFFMEIYKRKRPTYNYVSILIMNLYVNENEWFSHFDYLEGINVTCIK